MKGLKQIGKGSFSTVYRKNSKKVLIVSSDNVKECISLGWFPNSTLFPKITRLDYLDNGKSIYEMKFYGKVTSPKKQLNERSYELYKELRKLFNNFFVDHISGDYSNVYNRLFQWREQFSKLPSKFKRERDYLLEALDYLSNYGSDVCFEISPRNIACTKSGKIVLLDCFYFANDLKSVRNS